MASVSSQSAELVAVTVRNIAGDPMLGPLALPASSTLSAVKRELKKQCSSLNGQFFKFLSRDSEAFFNECLLAHSENGAVELVAILLPYILRAIDVTGPKEACGTYYLVGEHADRALFRQGYRLGGTPFDSDSCCHIFFSDQAGMWRLAKGLDSPESDVIAQFASFAAFPPEGSWNAGSSVAEESAQLSVCSLELDVDAGIEQCLELRGPRQRLDWNGLMLKALLVYTRKVLLSQPMLLELEAPVSVCGNIHGQYFDLLRHFDACGLPPARNYLFLGGYVNRGKRNIEVITLLFLLKVKYPENLFLLRGNHECASITRIYGFYDECKLRYDLKTWKLFIDVFNCLPACAVISQRIICMHGGLSPKLRDLDQIRDLQRPTDVPDCGLLTDLLWADPDASLSGWHEEDKGVSYLFGPDIVASFLRDFGLDMVCRAHQVVEDGYEFFAGHQLVTLFGATHFCGEFDNDGAIMEVDEGLRCSFKTLKQCAETKAECAGH